VIERLQEQLKTTPQKDDVASIVNMLRPDTVLKYDLQLPIYKEGRYERSDHKTMEYTVLSVLDGIVEMKCTVIGFSNLEESIYLYIDREGKYHVGQEHNHSDHLASSVGSRARVPFAELENSRIRTHLWIDTKHLTIGSKLSIGNKDELFFIAEQYTREMGEVYKVRSSKRYNNELLYDKNLGLLLQQNDMGYIHSYSTEITEHPEKYPPYDLKLVFTNLIL
jgi:hypothetical protein